MFFLFLCVVIPSRIREKVLYFLNGQSFCDPAHHDKELLEVDLAVAILVDLLDRLVELLLRVDVLEFFSSEERVQLFRVDFATVVLIEHLESRLQVVFAEEGLCAHSRRQEL